MLIPFARLHEPGEAETEGSPQMAEIIPIEQLSRARLETAEAEIGSEDGPWIA